MSSAQPFLTGYGPRARITFNGESESFQIWETRFTNFLNTLDKGVYNAMTGGKEGKDSEEKNRRAYAKLVQVLDERSLQLIMNDTRNDGQEAFEILKEHYASTEKTATSYTVRRTDNVIHGPRGRHN